MDTNALKKFAQEARRQLIAQVGSKLAKVLGEGSAARRESADAVKELEKEIGRANEEQIIERVAYTWFNRFTALRFMDANGHTGVKVVSPADGQTRPEILAEAVAGVIDESFPNSVRERVRGLLDGEISSPDAQAEAYALLVVASCNQWHWTMPFLFEKIADYSELLMPDDLLSVDSVLTKMRATMTEDACKDVEIIGWLYQFYISEKKDQVFAGLKKNIKITAENIPAATQLFTPHWIVRYLVENSLGRLWLLNRPQSKLAAQMDYYIAPEEPEADFLRLTKPEDIRICDPAAGSGHMLTYAFDLLHAIYEEEGYEPTEIPAQILTHNLHGVEIDDRAGALAAFALAMKAASRLGRRRFLRMEVKPDIVVLQNVSFTPAEMQDVAAVVGRDMFSDELRATLMQFEQAKNFGSLIVPKLRDPAETLRVVEARDFGGDLLLKEVQERVIAVLRMAEALVPKYHVVVANPPYMSTRGMNNKLRASVAEHFPDSKSDLMTAFMSRTSELTMKMGFAALVTLDSWMFLSSFDKLRTILNRKWPIKSLAHVGWNCFPDGHAYNRGVAFICQIAATSSPGTYLRLSDVPANVSKGELFLERCHDARHKFVRSVDDFENIPGEPIAYWASDEILQAFGSYSNVGKVAEPRQGLATADNDRFLRLWPEVSQKKIGTNLSTISEAVESRLKWFPYNKGGDYRKWFGNNEYVVNWEDDGFEIRNFADEDGNIRSRPQNTAYFFKRSLTWTSTSSFYFGIRHSNAGHLFDVKGSSCFANPDLHYPLLGLLASFVSSRFLSFLNPTIEFQNGNIKTIPICPELSDSEFRSSADTRVRKLVKISNDDWDAYETSWDFTVLPLLSSEYRREKLENSYAALRAHWQSMTNEMRALEEENNRIFIGAYGLQNELTPDVPIEEITLTCNPAYRYGVKGTEDDREARLSADTMAEFLHYAVGCMFGRYSLDAPGLILANQGEGLADYLARVPEPSFEVDADNVIPVLDGDWFADDITERFRKFLRVTFGDEKFQENLAFIEAALGKDVRKWFTKDFFDYHVRRYKKRPIYWMFSSPKGTFNALIYMHRYIPDTVNVVLNEYVRPFRHKLEAHRADLEKAKDSTDKSPAQQAKAAKEILTISGQIEELDKWERDVIFPLATQKIAIDLDDGVRANYPKFGTALKPIKGLDAADD